MRPFGDGESPPPGGPDEKERETRVNPLVSDICENERTDRDYSPPADPPAEENVSDEEFAKIEAKIIE